MSISSFLVGIIFILNMIFAAIVIFLERRDASSTWAWILVLFFIPGLGFILYILLGQNLSRRKMFQWEDQKKLGVDELIANQIDAISQKKFCYLSDVEKEYHDLIYLHLLNNDALLTQDNKVDIFTDGKKNSNVF